MRDKQVPKESGLVIAWLARAVEHGLADVDLTLAQYRLLGLLEKQPAGASALADRLTVTRPSVTALVDGLVGHGYVDRGHDAEDRRRVNHVLTAAGRDVLHRADEAVQECLSELLSEHADPSLEQRAVAGLLAWQKVVDDRHARQLAAIQAG